MIASLKRRGLYEVSIGLGKESYENENECLNDGDRYFGAICLALSPSLCDLIGSAKYLKDLWAKLDRTFGKHNDDNNSALEITSNTTRVIYSKVSASNLSDEVVQDEEEAEASTPSIRIEDSLHVMTPFPDAPEFHEISYISYSHIPKIK